MKSRLETGDVTVKPGGHHRHHDKLKNILKNLPVMAAYLNGNQGPFKQDWTGDRPFSQKYKWKANNHWRRRHESGIMG